MSFSEGNFSLKDIEERSREDTVKRTKITKELDELFGEMEQEQDPSSRENISGRIRDLLKQGRRVFENLKMEGRRELEEYRRRLEELEKK